MIVIAGKVPGASWETSCSKTREWLIEYVEINEEGDSCETSAPSRSSNSLTAKKTPALRQRRPNKQGMTTSLGRLDAESSSHTPRSLLILGGVRSSFHSDSGTTRFHCAFKAAASGRHPTRSQAIRQSSIEESSVSTASGSAPGS